MLVLAGLSWNYLLTLKGQTIAYDPANLPVAVYDYLRQASLNLIAEPIRLCTEGRRMWLR